ncbi:MAG: DUF695 domain-containing protein [Clostridia bacterium]|nr:DUF695 domain-containing protein [Clostridia bacterium]
MSARSSWLEYYWELEGEETHFGVELSLYKTAPDPEAPLLVYFCFQTIDEHVLNPSDIRRIEDIAAKIARKTDVVPAGFIEAGSMRQYYFYTSDKEQYDIMKEIAAKEKKLICRVGGKREENWATYFNLLYPDDMKYQTVKNCEQVKKLRSIGDNTDAARRINLHMGFVTEQERLVFEETARRAGFAIGSPEFQPESDFPNGVVVYRISTLKRHDIDSVTVRAIRLAKKIEGRLLFWDCNIVPKSVTKRL